MVNHGKQRSTEKPLELELTESRVFVYQNITEVDEQREDEQPSFHGWEFDLTEYTKDEYIKLQAERNAALEEQMTATEVALTEVYEMIG